MGIYMPRAWNWPLPLQPRICWLAGRWHGSGERGNASATAPRLSRLCPGISSSQPGLLQSVRPPDRAARRAARVAGGDGPAMGTQLSRSTPACRPSTRRPSGTRRSAPMSSSSMRCLPASRPRRASIRPAGRNLRTGIAGPRGRTWSLAAVHHFTGSGCAALGGMGRSPLSSPSMR